MDIVTEVAGEVSLTRYEWIEADDGVCMYVFLNLQQMRHVPTYLNTPVWRCWHKLSGLMTLMRGRLQI